MPTLLFTFDASLTPLLPVAQRERPAARAWPEGATLKHAIETFGVPHTEVGVVQVDGHAALLDALLPARGAVAVAGVRAALPDAPLHFLCDAHLGATARLLRMAGFDTAYDNNYADATIEALADTEDWIVLSRDRELLKRRGIRRGAFIRAREPQAQMREIVARFRLAEAARPFRAAWNAMRRCGCCPPKKRPPACRRVCASVSICSARATCAGACTGPVRTGRA